MRRRKGGYQIAHNISGFPPIPQNLPQRMKMFGSCGTNTQILFTFLFLITGSVAEMIPKVKVAVYEHNVTNPPIVPYVVSRQVALSNMMLNLNVMKARTEEASQQGAKLIVLPEYGIHGPPHRSGLNRTSLKPYLEYIPDPRKEKWNPCDNPEKHPNIDVQHFLSCLAKENSIYVVANYGDLQKCDITSDIDCPPSGNFQYNTNVVYDAKGFFVAKYHKVNLFFEYHFDFPKQVDVVTFSTPFGTFGTFTCFDILFHDPTIKLIEKHGIRNIVFPTAWMDEFPFFTSIQFHSAFAVGSRINFLAANIHIPSRRFHGSGIYTPNGAATYYFNPNSTHGRLLVAEITVLKTDNETLSTSEATDLDNKRQNYHITPYSSKSRFQAALFHDVFNMAPLSGLSGNLTICQNEICCHLAYKRSRDDALFAFGAFDGLHTHDGRYYLQICILLKCKHFWYNGCSSVTTHSNTHFHHFEIRGNFTSRYTYPEILTSNNESLTFPLPETWRFNNNVLTSNATVQSFISATLFSRIYDRDDGTIDVNKGIIVNQSCMLVIVTLLVTSWFVP